MHYLAEADYVDRDGIGFFGTGASNVNGVSYARSLNAHRNPGDRGTLSYDLGRKYSRFQATVGLRDDSNVAARQRFEVYADGQQRFSQELGLGESADIDVPVKGVLRLELVLITVPGDEIVEAVATWGDARAVG